MITGIIFVIGIAAAVYMARRYIKPIEQVVAAAGLVASGNLDHQLPEGRMDEIGELTTSFNRMVGRLRETRELEERLRKAEHLSTVGHLASGIAHEIRNPLNLISLTIDYINKLLTDPKSDEKDEISKRLANVKDEIRRLNAMVENFLNFGKLKKPELRPTSVIDLVDEVCVLSSSMMKDRKVEIETRSDNHIPLLMVDREQLKSCLLNIVINAVQAMPGGGRIRLDIMQEVEPGNEQVVRISVTDTGQGISPAELERIFEPYFTTKEAGIGLGLPLAKNLIEGHGGTIEVTSTVGVGTEVTLKLPIIKGNSQVDRLKAED
jgi:signal transduction histidine kinase